MRHRLIHDMHIKIGKINNAKKQRGSVKNGNAIGPQQKRFLEGIIVFIRHQLSQWHGAQMENI